MMFVFARLCSPRVDIMVEVIEEGASDRTNFEQAVLVIVSYLRLSLPEVQMSE